MPEPSGGELSVCATRSPRARHLCPAAGNWQTGSICNRVTDPVLRVRVPCGALSLTQRGTCIVYHANDDQTQEEKGQSGATCGASDYHGRPASGTPRTSQAQAQKEAQAVRIPRFWRIALITFSAFQQVPSPEHSSARFFSVQHGHHIACPTSLF